MFNSLKNKPISIFNLILLLCFAAISLLSLNIKFIVTQKLVNEFDVLTLVDIIRSEISFSIAVLLWFYLSLIYKTNKWLSLLNFLLFLLLSFFILKLLGIYVITHDATPYAMIEYGSYLFNVFFINPQSSLFIYIILPCLIFFTNYFYYLKVAIQPVSGKKLYLHFIILISLCLAFIAPQQKKSPLSLAYHPYVFTFQNAFTQKAQPLPGNTSPHNNMHKTQDIFNDWESLKPDKNIVLIILESVASNALNENTSPNIHQLKKQALNIEHAFAVIPHTSKALVAIHCGFTPYLDSYLYESTLGIPHQCLPALLRGKGYQSVYFQSPTEHFENRRALIQNIGFDEFLALESMDKNNFEKVNYFGYEDKIMLPKSHAWLSAHLENKQQPFIATYLTGTTHHNYDTPENFQKKIFSSHIKYNRYLNAVYYVDEFVGELIQQYKDFGIYDNTLFIIVSDHGEGFGEHKALLHNNNLYNSGLKIPLIFHHSALEEQSSETPLSHRSILHITLSLASNTNDLDVLEENIVSACWYQNYCYSLIHKQGNNIFKFLISPVDKHKALYELVSDPDEKNNILKQHPELSAMLEKELLKTLEHDYRYYLNWYTQQDKHFRDVARKTFSPFKSPE